MPKKTLVHFECDLCGSEKTDEKLPPGWLEVSIDSRYLDRHWHEKVVCEHCLKTIDNARERAKKK